MTNNNEVQVLANALHEATCTRNHTEECGWFYENQTGWTHEKYNEKAVKMLSALPDVDFDTIVKVVNTL